MRSVIDESGHGRIEIWTRKPADVAEEMNDGFQRAGMGRPVEDVVGGQVQGLVRITDRDEYISGGAFAARWVEADDLLAFHDMNAAVGRVHILTTVFVDSDLRHRGYGRALIKAVTVRARKLGAEHLIARLDSLDSITQRWFQRAGFTIFQPDVDLTIDGVVIPRERRRAFAWLPISNDPTVTVSASW